MQFWLENLAFLAETKGIGRLGCRLPIPYYNLQGDPSGVSPFSEGIGGTFVPYGMFGFQIISTLSNDEKGTNIIWSAPEPTLFSRPIAKYIIQKLNMETNVYFDIQEVLHFEFKNDPYQIYLAGEPSTEVDDGVGGFHKRDIFRVLIADGRDCVLAYSNEAYSFKSLYNKPFIAIAPPPPVIAPPGQPYKGPWTPPYINRFWTPSMSPRSKLPSGVSYWPPKTPPIPNPAPSGATSPPPLIVDPCDFVDPTAEAFQQGDDIVIDILDDGYGWDTVRIQMSTNGMDWTDAYTIPYPPPQNRYIVYNTAKNSTFYTRVLSFGSGPAGSGDCTSLGKGGRGNGGSVTTNPTLTTPAPPLDPFILTTVSYTGPAWALGRRGHFIWESAGPSTLHYTFQVSTDGINFSHMARLTPQARLSIGLCGLGGRCIAPMFRRGVTYYLRVKATSVDWSILYSNTVTVTSGAPVFPFRGGGAAANQDTHWFFHNQNDDNSQERGFINHKHTFWLDDNVSPNLINLFYLKMSDGTEYKVQYTQKEGIVDSPREWIAPDGSGPCSEPKGFYIDNVYVYSGETRMTPESDEDQLYINLGGIVNVSYYRSQGRPAPDYTTLIEYSTNDSLLSGVDEIGGWFYHFSKKVAFEESEPYHAVGNGVDGIGLFLGTDRAAYETSYQEESPLSGVVPAYNEKMGYGTGHGIPGVRFGEVMNHGLSCPYKASVSTVTEENTVYFGSQTKNFAAADYRIKYLSGAHIRREPGQFEDRYQDNVPLVWSTFGPEVFYNDGANSFQAITDVGYYTGQAQAQIAAASFVNGSSFTHTGGKIYIKYTDTNYNDNQNGSPNMTFNLCSEKTDFCWDPLVSRSAMVKISYNLSNLKNFRGKIDGSIYNIPTGGGEMQEIGGIKYENIGFGIGFGNPSTIINNLYINVTGYIPSVDGYGCSICHNARLSGSGDINSSAFSTIHDIDGFDFSVGLSGTLRFSGTYKKYSPIFTCLSETDLGEVESVEYVEDIPYSILDQGFGFSCVAGNPPCNVIDTEKSVIQQLYFDGMEYPVPDSFWRARVVNNGDFPVSISVYRITVSGHDNTIIDYSSMGLYEDGLSQTWMNDNSSPSATCGEGYESACSFLCPGKTGYWDGTTKLNAVSTPFSTGISPGVTDFFVMLARSLSEGAAYGQVYPGSDSIQEDLQYVKSSTEHVFSQKIVDYFNKIVNYRSGVNNPLHLAGLNLFCTHDRLIEFHKDYRLENFAERSFIVREECEKSYIDFDIDFDKITYNPIGVKVRNESNFPVLLSVGAGRFKTNYGVVDPSGVGEYGNRGEIDFDSYVYDAVNLANNYPTGSIGFIGPRGGESREYLIDPNFDYIVLHVARYALGGNIYPYFYSEVAGNRASSTINDIYIFSKNGVDEEILNHYRQYDSGHTHALNNGQSIPIYGKMALPIIAEMESGSDLFTTQPVRVYEKTGDFEKNKNILLTYSENLDFIIDLSGNFVSGSASFPPNHIIAGGAGEFLYDTAHHSDINIPLTYGSHFAFQYLSGIEKAVRYGRGIEHLYGDSSYFTGIYISVGERLWARPQPCRGSSYSGFHITNHDVRNIVANYGVRDSGQVMLANAHGFGLAHGVAASEGNLFFNHMNVGMGPTLFTATSESGIAAAPYPGMPMTLSQAAMTALMHNSWEIEHPGSSMEHLPGTPIWKSSYFEVFVLSGNTIAGYIKGGDRVDYAFYSTDAGGVALPPDDYVKTENIENLLIKMYRVNHSVSIANYGAELFTCS